MKKLFVISALATIGAMSAMGQGQIVFGNNGVTTGFKTLLLFDGNDFRVVGTASTAYGMGPGSVRIVLLVGANGGALTSLVPVTATTTHQMVTNSTSTLAIAQGTFNGGTPNIPTGYAWSDGCSAISFAYVGWQIASGVTDYSTLFYGNTFTPFSSYYSGWTGIINGYNPGRGTVVAPQTFGSASYQTPRLLFVPEPATFPLAGLGAAALLLFHCRKQADWRE